MVVLPIGRIIGGGLRNEGFHIRIIRGMIVQTRIHEKSSLKIYKILKRKKLRIYEGHLSKFLEICMKEGNLNNTALNLTGCLVPSPSWLPTQFKWQL